MREAKSVVTTREKQFQKSPPTPVGRQSAVTALSDRIEFNSKYVAALQPFVTEAKFSSLADEERNT